ncbi:galactose oxidase-like domain-containing protein [Amnibacterium kyonggiense]
MHPTRPSSTLPERRRLRRVAVPVIAATGLVVGSLAAAALPSGSASAADTGSYTIGGSVIPLNQPSDPEMGVLTPTSDAAQNGMFGSQVDWPIIPIHAALARDGHLISFGTPLGSVNQGGLTYDDWDPSAGFSGTAHVDTASMNDYDSFCNSLVELADGRLLMVGGNSTMSSMIYDPSTDSQTMGASLSEPRWYTTTLRLTDGRILVLGGGIAGANAAYKNPASTAGLAVTPEIGTGTGAWTQLTGATDDDLFGGLDNHWWYPRAFNAPDGSVVGFSGDQVWTLSAAGAGSVQRVGTLPFNPRVSGSQVMYAPGKILIAGGGQNTNADGDETVGSNQAAILDVSGTTPVATSTGSMAFGRNWLNLTVLPSGEVLANGGTTVGTDAGDANSVKQAEIWNPATGVWRTAATAQRTRTYHSTSLLLPSGAVFTGGGGAPGPEDNLNAELYYPAYLFTKGADGTVHWADRPAITGISGSATYGGTLDLQVAPGDSIASASLISSPSVTHSQNTDQRRIPLDVRQSGNDADVTLPGSLNTMPPGDYELTVSNSAGVPSAAQIITIRSSGAGMVTVGAAGQVKATVSTPQPGSAPSTGAGVGAPASNTEPGTGATPPAQSGTGATPPAQSGTGATPPAQSGTGATPPARSGTAAPSTAKAPLLKPGQVVSLETASHAGRMVVRSGSTVMDRTVGARSSRSARDAASWIVHTGSGSSKGFSLESVSRPGYYLAASTHGSGSMTLLRKSGSAAFRSRTTFSVVRGVAGKGLTLRLTAHPSLVMRTIESQMVLRSYSGSSLRSWTLIDHPALARRR